MQILYLPSPPNCARPPSPDYFEINTVEPLFKIKLTVPDIYVKNIKLRMKLINEEFNIKNGLATAKDGHQYKIAYIDPATSENTFNFRESIKRYNAKFFPELKAWGWFLGQDPEGVYRKYIQPCLEYLTTVEDNGEGNRQNQVTQIIDQLIQELSGTIQSIKMPTAKNVLQELTQFKADLMNCMSSEEFKAKLEPIIKFQQAQGHRCSFRNAILIIFQDPQATMVKSETAWKNMNRIVTDKSHAIILFRPNKEPLTPEEREMKKLQFLRLLGVKSEAELNPGQKEELRVQLNGGELKDGAIQFKPYFAYDIRFTEQMKGKDTLVDPKGNQELEWYDKSTDEHEYTQLLVNSCIKMIQDSGVKIEYVPLESMGGALGVSCSGKIKLSDKPVYTQNYFSTMVHEFSHELLHQKYLSKSGTEEYAQLFVGKAQGRAMVEQQAELSAWIVCKHFNLDRVESLNYTASWGLDDKTCAKVFDTVANCASFIINKIGVYMEASAKEFNQTDNNTENKIQ